MRLAAVPPPPGAPPSDWIDPERDDPVQKLLEATDAAGSDDDDDLDWRRGERVLTDDGALTGRRLERTAASDAYRTYDAPALGPLDEVVLDVRGDPRSAQFFAAADAEAALAELPWTRVAFGLGGGGIWHCLRELQVGDVVRLRCAGSRAVEFLTTLARAEASEGDGGPDRMCAPRGVSEAADAAIQVAARGGGGAVAVEVRLVARRAVVDCSAAADGSLLLCCVRAPPPEHPPLAPPEMAKLRCSLLVPAPVEGAPEPAPELLLLALRLPYVSLSLTVGVPGAEEGAPESLLAALPHARPGGRYALRIAAGAVRRTDALILGSGADDFAAGMEVAVEVVERVMQEAVGGGGRELKRVLQAGVGSVSPSDHFEAELLVTAAADDGTAAATAVRLCLSLGGADGTPPRLRAADGEGEADDEAAAALERCARRMLRQEVALLRLPLAVDVPGIGAARALRVHLDRIVRVVLLPMPAEASSSAAAAEHARKRCVSSADLERLERAVLSPAMFGMGGVLGGEQPVQDECTVRLTLLPSVADDDGNDDDAPLASPVQLEVVAGACELGAGWEPLLSSLAFSGETALFELPPPADADLRRRLRRALAGEDDDLGPRAGLRAEVVAAADLGDDWSRLVRDAAAAAPACAAAGRSLVGLRVDAIAAPPDKRHATPAEQLAHLRGLRRRVVALFGAGEASHALRKALRSLWVLQELGAKPTFNPETNAEEFLAAPREWCRALLAAPPPSAPGAEAAVAVAAEGAARREEMEGLWREAALAVAACALTLGRVDLAQLACRRVIAEEAGCVDAHVHLAHALYAERDLDGALAALRQAVVLRPGHREARALHGEIATLRRVLKEEERRRRAASRGFLG